MVPVWTYAAQSSLSLWVKTAQAAESSYGQFIGTLKEESEGMLAPVMPASRCSNNFFFFLTKLPLCVLICLPFTVYILRLPSIAQNSPSEPPGYFLSLPNTLYRKIFFFFSCLGELSLPYSDWAHPWVHDQYGRMISWVLVLLTFLLLR